MKKVLSVALASAMVLGMGANAFAISYSTGSNNEADWPTDFQFDGELFVTDKDGDIIEESTTELNDNEAVDFEPGDVIWMPLYAEDQLVYDAEWTEGTDAVDSVSSVRLDDTNVFITETEHSGIYYYKQSTDEWFKDAAYTDKLTKSEINKLADEGVTLPNATATGAYYGEKTIVTGIDVDEVPGYDSEEDEITFDGKDRIVVKNSAKFYINGKQYKSVEAFEEAVEDGDVVSG